MSAGRSRERNGVAQPNWLLQLTACSASQLLHLGPILLANRQFRFAANPAAAEQLFR